MGIIARLTHGEHGGWGTEFLLQEADGGDGASLANEQGLTGKVGGCESPCAGERRGATV